MYGEGLLMMSTWLSKHVELYRYRYKIKIYHKLHLLVYLLEYMKMHGPGNIKFVNQVHNLTEVFRTFPQPLYENVSAGSQPDQDRFLSTPSKDPPFLDV
jgi:hypothetical protein